MESGPSVSGYRFGNQYDYPGIDGILGEITISFSQLYYVVKIREAVK